MPITIKLNGEEFPLDRSMDVMCLLEILKIPAGSVVAERNREILHKEVFEQVILEDGDELELIRFVGGG